MYYDEGKKTSVINNIIKIIRNWNTVYHPTESDYRKLAEEIINLLEKEKVITCFKHSDDKITNK